MELYKNLSGQSGVHMYEIGEDYVRVKFHRTARIYIYSCFRAGLRNVEHMKQLARAGMGLNSFIMREVKDLFDR